MKKHIKSLKWKNTCLEAWGDFTAFMCIHHKEIYDNEWDNLVSFVKSEYIETLSDKIKKMWIDEESSGDIWINISSNMVDFFMLDYCAEYYKSEYHRQLLEIYLSGHIACGWKGKYPKGKFLVY